MKYIYLIFLFLASISGFAQTGNDDCANATDFGTLTPFIPACLLGSTSTALGELPYINQGNCFGGTDAPSPAADVWFTFTAVGNLLDIVLDSDFDTSMVALYQNTCDGLIGLKCIVNESGGYINTSFSPVSVGITYYIQISGGNISDTGNYSLCINSYQTFEAICIIDQTITVDPPPYLGTYEAGQTVQICLLVGGYQENSADWFDGLVPVFGSAWDLTTLTPVSPASCDGQGTWDWYDSVQGTSTYAQTNVGAVGPGFFYDRNNDGNPGNDFGDYSSGNACNWEFCMTITTKAACPPGVDGEDLSIEFFNYSDSEAGSWNASSSPCPNDPNFTFKALLSCCTIPEIIGISPTCNDPLTGSVTVIGGGQPPFFYEWSTGFSETAIGGSTVSGLPIGFYNVTVTDANDCEKIISYLLANSEIPYFSLSYSVPSTCNPGNGLAVLMASGTIPPYTFTLTTPSGTTITQTETEFTNLAPGSYNAIVVDGGGCFNELNFVITGLPPLVTQIDNIVPGFCAGDSMGSISLSATGGFPPYTFSIDGGTFQTNGNFNSLTEGVHNILVTDVSGCATTTEAVIPAIVPVISDAQITTDILCFGGNEGAFTISATGGTGTYTYSTDDGQTFLNENTVSGLEAGSYNYLVQDSNGCLSVSNSIAISQPDLLTIALPEDTEINEGSFVIVQPQIISGEAATYSWFPSTGLDCDNCPQVKASPTNTTTYTVVVANSNGCSTQDSISISVLKGGAIIIPNAFSPNGDGVNDVFRVVGRNITQVSVVVYNRWGQEIFASKDLNIGWNGMYKDTQAELGVYAYIVEAVYTNGDIVIKKGNLTLIR